MEQITGYEGLYEIHLVGTPDGRPGVWSVWSSRYLKLAIQRNGYLAVCLHRGGKQKSHCIHRLVAEHFIDGSGIVDHIDRDRTNNMVTNLRWVNHSENKQNAAAKGYTWREAVKRWQVHLSIKGKHYYGGYFANEDDARAKYLELKRLYHPAFAELPTEGQ